MAIVTGDRYLESLVKFVEKQAGPLIEGTLVLKLNPVGLHYVQSRLEYLEELERLLAGAPVDYLRAYVSDLGDHRALEQLRRILRLLTSLKVVSVLSPPSCRDPTPVCLLPFGRLRVLELRGCDLSTSAARGLLELRHTLEKITCHNSTDALRHVFASRIAEIEDSPQWKRLSFVSCAYNGLVLMDDSLRLLPVVETLDLSRNKFAKVDNLWKCGKLKYLDLGFNQLRTITSFSKVSCQIVKLVLRNNALTTLRGVETLKSLEGLDLSYNIISSFSEIELLAGLPSLQSLWLEGNPVCSASWYRAQVYSFFPDPDKLILDDEKISTRDVWKRQIIITSRHKQPASFGFYSPAKYEAELEGSVDTKRKKLSRIASIESQTGTPESSDNDSVTCIDEALENADSNEKAEIVDFINKIESMKTERSSLWLEEFKQWMNHASEDSVKSVHTGREGDHKKKRRLKHFGETSGYASNSIEVSGDENSMKLPGSYNALNGESINTESEQSSYEIGEAASKYLAVPTDKDESILKHTMLKSYYDIGLDPIRNTKIHIDFQVPGVEGIISNNSVGQEMIRSNKKLMRLDTIDDVIEARSPSRCASPPHYQEHILHRRHDLEEEFLQLSAESYSVASSDSYTSDCSDDPVEVGSHMHTESTIDDISRSVDSPTFVHSSEDSFSDRRQITGNGTHPSSSCTEHTFNKEHRDSDACQQSCNSNQGSPYGGEVVHPLKQEASWLEKKKCKRKPKRRVVSLTENPFSSTDGTDTDDMMESSHKSNCSPNQGGACRQNADVNGGSQILAGDVANVSGETHGTKTSEELILSNFNAQLAGFGIQETCKQYIHCNFMLEESSGCNESEVILLSSEHMLYILLPDGKTDGSGSRPCLVGSLGAEDVKEVLVGLGLQAVRVYIKRGTRYMFITRNIEKSRQLISVLEFFHSHAKKNGFPLISLDQIQVALFEKDICGGSKTNILQYSMVLFWNDSMEENSWLSRSLFVLGGQILVCIEDISQFGFDSEDTYAPYFSIHSCCAVADALGLVIEADASCCVTLTLKSAASGFSKKPKKRSKRVTWKLKWFCRDSLLKFVTLVNALHAGATTSSLIVSHTS